LLEGVRACTTLRSPDSDDKAVSHRGRFKCTSCWRILLATMRPPVPPEVALLAFFEEHRRCGELDGGVEGEMLWMTCECGADITHSLLEAA
jgi:hypothetical protein